MHIGRHNVDLDLARGVIGATDEALQLNLQRTADGEIGELAAIRSDAVAGIAGRCVVREALPEIARLLRVASRAGAALWSLAERGETQIQLGPISQPVLLKGKVHEGYLSSVDWLRCYWLATLDGDREACEILCRSTRDLRPSSARTDEHNHLFAEAMRKYALGDPLSRATAERALTKAESGPHILSADWVRSIDRPQIEVAVHVMARDGASTDRALANAFEAHRLYWGVPSRANRHQGWISTSLAALAVLARRAGILLTTTSDYAPDALVTHG